MRQDRQGQEKQTAAMTRTLWVEVDTAIRHAMASGADEADACHEAMAIVGSRINRLNARRAFKMVIQ